MTESGLRNTLHETVAGDLTDSVIFDTSMTEHQSPAESAPRDPAADVRPEPAAAGSAGTQAASPEPSENAIVRVVQPLSVDQNHLGAALGEFSDVRSPAVLALAVAAYRDAEQYRAAVIKKWDEAEQEKAHVRQAYYEEKEKNAVLEERQRGRIPLRRIQQFAILVGGLIGGGGLAEALAKGTLLGIGGVLLVVGLAVLSLGSSLFGKED